MAVASLLDLCLERGGFILAIDQQERIVQRIDPGFVGQDGVAAHAVAELARLDADVPQGL